jgi:hypothetical protein
MKDQKVDVYESFKKEFGIHFSPSELQFVIEFLKKNFIAKSELKLHNDRLKSCLQYCKEQNGIPYCKNCSLYEEDLLKELELDSLE